MKIERLSGRTIQYEGKEFIYCSGTDYLGLAYDSNYQSYILEGYHQYGLNYGSTRKHKMFEDIYEQAESIFAEQLKLESALTVSSGTLAGQLVRHVIDAMSYTIIESPRLHPALKDIKRDALRPHFINENDHLLEIIQRQPSDKIALLGVTIDPLTISSIDLNYLDRIDKEILLVLDDTHGLGVVGTNGSGYLDLHPALRKYEVILISSLAKGMSLPGGLIAGSKRIIDIIKNSGHFAGSSPISPPYLNAFIKYQDGILNQHQKLQTNIEYFQSRAINVLIRKMMKSFPIVRLDENEALAQELLSKSIWISSIRYPYPHSELLNRIILSGAHQQEDLDIILAALTDLSKEKAGH